MSLHGHLDHNHNQHKHSHPHGNGAGRVKMLVIILFNAIITIAEYAGGMISGSLALISDAGHNLSDVLALILGYAGERVSGKKPDRTYTFGLKRFEVLIALVNSLSLIFIGLYIVYEAVMRYLNPLPIDPKIMLPVAAIGLAGNVFSILVLGRDRESNLNLRAAFLHLLYDAISSLAVIGVAVVLLFSGLYVLDLVISIVIVLMMVWSSIDILKESLRIFMQGTPRHIDADEVYNAVLSVENIASVHGLHIWSISSSETFLSCHICIASDAGNVDTDGIIRRVNKLLEERFGIDHTTLQVEVAEFCNMRDGTCCR
jgi:cobalt-zinc-cadmium efflux system protein